MTAPVTRNRKSSRHKTVQNPIITVKIAIKCIKTVPEA